MKRVYQTSIEEGKGNCVAACVASILNLELDQVPSLLPDVNQVSNLIQFMKSQGYEYRGTLYNKNSCILEHTTNQEYCFKKEISWHEQSLLSKETISGLNGIDGLFLATVLSPRLSEVKKNKWGKHQVICDKNFNIVHDPNELYKDILRYPLSELLGFNGICFVQIFEKKS